MWFTVGLEFTEAQGPRWPPPAFSALQSHDSQQGLSYLVSNFMLGNPSYSEYVPINVAILKFKSGILTPKYTISHVWFKEHISG